MKKLMGIVIQIALVYAIPLLGRPELLANFKVLACILGAAVVLFSQPAMSAREAKEKKSTDHGSMFFIQIGALLGQVVAISEWAYFPGEPHGIRNPIVVVVGIAMMVGGIGFRIWSIQTLGKFFTATVQIKDEHRVVTSGPYRFVRHPSYLGAFAAIVGSAVFLEAPIGVLVCSGIMLIAYKIRIDVEEIALVSAMGDAYRSYQRRTRRMIPCVW